MKFPPYPRYKDSGIEWLGEVPEHWEVLRNKVIFKEVDERSSTGSEELLTVSHITGVTPRSEKEVNMFLAETLEGYKKSKRGDLIINTMWAFMGALGLTDYDGVVSPSYNVYRFRTQGKVHPKYLDHLYRTPNHIIEILRFSKGIWDSRLRLYPDAFLSMRIALQPYKEQEEIVEYLDHETLKIDELIGKQERLITLLQEKRQALISHAVTKGLNPNAPRKDSSIAWLGEIPQHWDVLQARRITVSHKQGYYTEAPYIDEGVKLLRITDIDSKHNVFFAQCPFVEIMPKDEEIFNLQVGDFVFARSGAIGTFGVVQTKERVVFASYLIRFRFREHLDFLKYMFDSSYFQESLVSTLHGGANKNVHAENIKNPYITLPPLTEQKEIAKYLDCETLKIDALTEKAQWAIELLKEHRMALISSTVTGMIDVRQNRNGNLSNH